MFEDIYTGNGFSFIVASVIVVIAYIFLMRILDSKYPKVYTNVTYKGSRRLVVYRSLGDIIVLNNLIDLFTQNYTVMGIKSSLEWYIQDVNIFTRGVRVYDAELIADFLFRKDKKEQVERVVDIDGKKIIIGKDGLLFPLKFSEPKQVDYEDIRKGKVIVERFLNEMIKNNRILEGNNPLLSMIYTSLPILLIVLAVGVMLYLTQTGMADTNLLILKELANLRAAMSN